MNTFRRLPPFPNFCCSIGHIPTSYEISLSYEDQLFWFCDFLKNTVIPTVNQNSEALKETQRLFIQLKEWCEHYFDNLDVQEEINNKLDELVENGTLQDMIDNYLDELYQKNKLVFMPIANETDYNYSVGDCTILITRTGKTFLIDTGNEHSYTLIKDKLTELNVSKIDYMLITHYHVDHCANLPSLVSDFDFSDTIFYLPKNNINATDESSAMKTLVNSLTLNNIKVYPSSSQTLQIDDITITFCNCSDDDITYYNGQNTSANNFSICCYIEQGSFSCFMSGDIYGLATERLYTQGWLKKVDIMKSEHHGKSR